MMEMFVVLSVLAGMAALSYPLLRSPLSKLRLKAAGQEVASELAKARVKAMQTGVPQAFRIQVHTGHFQIAAVNLEHDSPEDAKLKSDQRVATEEAESNSTERSPMTDAGDHLVEDRTLPEGICFEMPVDDVKEEKVPIEAVDDEDRWTNFAVFYPDGATTSAVVELRGEPEMALDIRLSGLTGVARIGEAHRMEQR